MTEKIDIILYQIHVQYYIGKKTIHTSYIEKRIIMAYFTEQSFVVWQKYRDQGAKRVRGNVWSSIEDQVHRVMYWVELGDKCYYDNEVYKKSDFYQYVHLPQYAFHGVFHEPYYDICAPDNVHTLVPYLKTGMKTKTIVMYS